MLDADSCLITLFPVASNNRIINILRIISLIALLSGLFFIPALIESTIEKNIDLNAIRNLIETSIKKRSGGLLEIKIEGVRFKLLHGIIFSGVKIYPVGRLEEGATLFQSENLILEVSYWDAMKKKFPVKGVRIMEGRFNPWTLNRKEWSRITEEFSKTSKDEHPKEEVLRIKKVALKGEGIRIYFSDKNLPSDLIQRMGGYLLFDFQIASFDQSPIKGSLKIRPANSEESKLKFDGSFLFLSSDVWRIHYQVKSLPVPLFLTFVKDSLLVSENSKLPDNLNITSGSISGTGSIRAYTSEGIGFHLIGKYEKAGGDFPDSKTSLLRFHKISGDLEINAGYRLDPLRLMFVRFTLNQKEMSTIVEYEKKEPAVKSDTVVRFQKEPAPRAQTERLTLRSKIKISSGKKPDTGTISLGEIDASGTLHSELDFWRRSNNNLPVVTGTVRLESAEFQLPPALFLSKRLEKKRIPLTLKLDSVKIDIGDAPPTETLPFFMTDKNSSYAKLSASGTLLDSRVDLNGAGEIRMIYADDEKKRTALEQNMQMEVKIDGYSFRDLIVQSFFAHQYFYDMGTDPDATKAEDQGALWEHRFMESSFYRSFLAPTRFKLKIRMENMKDTEETLPARFDADIEKNSEFLLIKIPDTKTDAVSFGMNYQIGLNRPIPRHDLNFNFSNSKNNTPFPEILHNETPPQSISFTMVVGGDGWHIADLMSRSYSTMNLQVTGVDFQNIPPSKIATYGLQLVPEDFMFERFELQRTTSGTETAYSKIMLQSERMDAVGSGTFSLQDGGHILLNYIIHRKDEPLRRGVFRMKITDDDVWYPEVEN